MSNQLHNMKCWKCAHEWKDKSGQHGDHYSGCPACGSLYWTDFDLGGIYPQQTETNHVNQT